jgi:K+-transporting ATPase KdpF subunit
MGAGDVGALVVAAALFLYLAYSLFRAERF